jgi:hypothetical protein
MLRASILPLLLFSFLLPSVSEAAPSFSFSEYMLLDIEGSSEASAALDTEVIRPCPNSDSEDDEPFRELSVIKIKVRNNLKHGNIIEKIRWRLPGAESSELIHLNSTFTSEESREIMLPFAVSNPADDGKILFGSNYDIPNLGFKNIKIVLRSRDATGKREVHRLTFGVYFGGVNRCL